MMLKPRWNIFTPPNFSSSSAAQLGTNQKYAVDRTWPLEEIIIVCDVTCGATGPTPQTAPVDSMLALIKHVNFSVNDGVQPRTIVDFSGVGLLEYAALTDDNLDTSTLDYIAQTLNGAAFANNLKTRVTYRIPLVHPNITEPLRTRMLLPIHTYPQDPILSIDFETGANLYSAGSISALSVHVFLKRREMSIATTAAIQTAGGFIGFDLLESTFNIGTGAAGELRFAIPTPGSYGSLMFRQYLGGASVTRAPVDGTTTFGSEPLWRMESGGVVPLQWRWKDLQIMNDWRRSRNGLSDYAQFVAATSAGSPTKESGGVNSFSTGLITSGQRWNAEATTIIDFMSPDGDSVNELGSLLDCNLPTNTGLKMELVGSPASVATNGSTIYVSGHRYFGDLSMWQAQKF